jgi:hypothetical protein
MCAEHQMKVLDFMMMLVGPAAIPLVAAEPSVRNDGIPLIVLQLRGTRQTQK